MGKIMSALKDLIDQDKKEKEKADQKRAAQKTSQQEKQRIADQKDATKKNAEKAKSLINLDKEITKVFNALSKDQKTTSQAVVNNTAINLRFGVPNTTFERLTNLFGWRNRNIGKHLTNDDIQSCIENNESFKAYAKELKNAELNIRLSNITLPEITLHKKNLKSYGLTTLGLGMVSSIALANAAGLLIAMAGAFPTGIGFSELTTHRKHYASLSLSFKQATESTPLSEAESNNVEQELLDELNQQQVRQPKKVASPQGIIK